MWAFSTEVTVEDLEQAYEWHMNIPSFTRGNFDDKQDFLNNVSADRAFKGSIDGEYKGLVLGEIKSSTVIEGHLCCERRLNKDFLTALIMFAKTESLKTYEQVLIELPAKSKGLERLIERAGFRNIGLSKWSDVIRGQLLEMNFYTAES